MTDRIQIIPELVEVLGIDVKNKIQYYINIKHIDGGVFCGPVYGKQALIKRTKEYADSVLKVKSVKLYGMTYKQLWELEELVFKIKSKVIHFQAEGDNSYVYEDMQYYPTEEKYIGVSSTTREQALQKLIVILINNKVLDVEAVRKVVCGE